MDKTESTEENKKGFKLEKQLLIKFDKAMEKLVQCNNVSFYICVCVCVICISNQNE